MFQVVLGFAKDYQITAVSYTWEHAINFKASTECLADVHDNLVKGTSCGM